MGVEQNINDFEWLETVTHFTREECGVDVNQIKQLPLEIRAAHLLSIITSAEEIEACEHRPTIIPNGDTAQICGLALIKPEMIPDKDRIISKFTELRTNPIELPIVHMSHSQWMQIYGNRIQAFPEIVYLYFTQRAFGMIPILFDYPGNERYPEHKQEELDIAEAFNLAYCGHAYERSPNTFRGGVVASALVNKGFIDMSGFASVFDPFKYFFYQSPRRIFGTFNGIHIPDSSQECIENFATLFGDRLLK